MAEPTDLTLRTRLTRARVRRRILACTNCPLHERCRSPVPFAVPEIEDPAYMVLGEAPGGVEDRKGRPFVGPAGRQMRRMMRQAGLLPDAAVWANTVCCWPGGKPGQDEQDACRHHLTAQVGSTDVDHILAAGSVAFEALVPDVKVSVAHGALFRVDIAGRPRHVMPIYHPAYVLREPWVRSKVVDALRRFRGLLEGLPPEWLLGGKCAACGVSADMWADDGVPFCSRHQGEINARRRKALRRAKVRRTKRNRAGQQALEVG